MWTLVVNCGSSSLKFALLNSATGETPLSGLAERLGSDLASVRVDRENERVTVPLPRGSYPEAFGVLLAELDALGLRRDVRAVGHRVVHGGDRFNTPVLITPEVVEVIRACIPLAPLHNPANLAGIEAARAAFPDLPQVAVFDTAFHQSMPPVAYRYAVPTDWYTHYGVRRYGFHGISHEYVAGEAARRLGRDPSGLNLVTAHLGNGCSVAAVQGGRSIDTSMGLTPLEGLVMGTRSGDVDPGLPDYLAREAGLSLPGITAALYRESGLLGLSGLTNDMRELEEAARQGNENARLAVDIFVYRLAKAIAGMATVLGTLDALVFTGGIGENSATVRAATLARLGLLGFRLDEAANAQAVRGQGGVITSGGVPALVVNTNEELMIARETAWVVAGGA
ncbi:acetate kinase [Deinococcus metallilatus]|uniref:Acetate kinase n=1 Tax=Deinococcus metallilatus TaxID=1211322 RepID=A0AAJ5F6D7_9DEIO|nr:acetate kinase [Deinococcus metallilatus]MBB5294476.1 acetate kinase [Deinococcus metallilatus]QBY07530.1 acetate kinase [Deinococcus metallilatus]RXJ13946.1 acetate kinase [Deinococcus metallilatus]TLK29911.1 acetate kinase [Deinococcus metallilatus]GMA15692.1 acetate kinase [Deinococcus metallilatus]